MFSICNKYSSNNSLNNLEFISHSCNSLGIRIQIWYHDYITAQTLYVSLLSLSLVIDRGVQANWFSGGGKHPWFVYLLVLVVQISVLADFKLSTASLLACKIPENLTISSNEFWLQPSSSCCLHPCGHDGSLAVPYSSQRKRALLLGMWFDVAHIISFSIPLAGS